jgi:hypothetical protein
MAGEMGIEAVPNTVPASNCLIGFKLSGVLRVSAESAEIELFTD